MFLNLENSVVIYVSFLLTILWTILWALIIYRLKPKLVVDSVEKENDLLKIRIINKGSSNAVNLRIEACYVSMTKNYTYHFEVDREDFLILTKYRKSIGTNTRIFKIDSISKSALKYTDFATLLKSLDEGLGYIRIRIHAFHEYSGLGKAFESIFISKENGFKKINYGDLEIQELELG